MNKEEQQEKALQYALGTLPQDEAQELERLMAEDRDLQAMVHEWQRVNEADALDCEQIEPSFHVYSTVMSRIDTQDRGEKSSPSSRGVIPFGVYVAQWGGWAAAAGLAVLLGVTIVTNRGELGGGSGSLGGRVESEIVLNELGNPEFEVTVSVGEDEEEFQDRLLELTGLAEAYWFSREGLPPDSDSGVDAQEFTGGFSIYDRKIKIGVIGIENIPEGRLGRYYSVWAKPTEDGEPVWAGMIQQGEPGSRMAFFDLSSNEAIQETDEAITFFVTEEDEKRPIRPEGRIVLSGI